MGAHDSSGTSLGIGWSCKINCGDNRTDFSRSRKTQDRYNLASNPVSCPPDFDLSTHFMVEHIRHLDCSVH